MAERAAVPAPGGAVDPWADFRPRRGRRVAQAMAAATLLLFTAAAVTLPGATSRSGWHLLDRVALIGFAALVAGFIHRYAMLRARPTREGLEVRNLITTRRVAWPQIMGVRFSGGDPWVRLELTDTEEVAVMAVQRADGDHARREAARLAALVEAGSRIPRDR